MPQTREEQREYNRQYYQKNKEKLAEHIKQYYQENKETTQCENCDVELTEDRYNTSTTRVLDHSHITGQFRNILCCACNNRRKEDNF
mgnify:CR=1 FL=1